MEGNGRKTNKMHEISSSYRMVNTHNTHLNTNKTLFFFWKKEKFRIVHSKYTRKTQAENSNNCYRAPKADE